VPVNSDSYLANAVRTLRGGPNDIARVIANNQECIHAEGPNYVVKNGIALQKSQMNSLTSEGIAKLAHQVASTLQSNSGMPDAQKQVYLDGIKSLGFEYDSARGAIRSTSEPPNLAKAFDNPAVSSQFIVNADSMHQRGLQHSQQQAPNVSPARFGQAVGGVVKTALEVGLLPLRVTVDVLNGMVSALGGQMPRGPYYGGNYGDMRVANVSSSNTLIGGGVRVGLGDHTVAKGGFGVRSPGMFS
jgi:hypothetical protein